MTESGSRVFIAALAAALLLSACGEASSNASPQKIATSSGTAAPPTAKAPTATTAAQDQETTAADDGEVEQLRVEVIAEYPHDRRAFTQGLLWHRGVLYESTGQYGFSSLRRVDPESGQVLVRRSLDSALFGEGLTLIEGETPEQDRLIQITWYAGMALVWERENFVQLDQFAYEGEGWGLAYDGEHLIMSDGTARLRIRDAETFELVRTVEATLRGVKQKNLNELEAVDGDVYANVWGEDRILRIDPETGRVEAEIDGSGLLTAKERRRADVLNGIAYDPESGDFWITGKYWPKMFRVRFVPAG